jgi:hypothetical protein
VQPATRLVLALTPSKQIPQILPALVEMPQLMTVNKKNATTTTTTTTTTNEQTPPKVPDRTITIINKPISVPFLPADCIQ